ncbi:MAG: RNA polymerase sigma factor [Draconibacterium sp.]
MNSNHQKISEFMQLYKPLQHKLSAYCRVVAGTEEKAFDLIQDTLARAFENFHTLRDREAFQFFLIGIARNCHLKQQRRKRFFEKSTNAGYVGAEIQPDSTEMRYDVELLHKCIARLNEEQRETVLLFHIMGFPIKEIAQNLAISEAAVKNRLVRGREKLRELLSDKESERMRNKSVNKINQPTK